MKWEVNHTTKQMYPTFEVGEKLIDRLTGQTAFVTEKKDAFNYVVSTSIPMTNLEIIDRYHAAVGEASVVEIGTKEG